MNEVREENMENQNGISAYFQKVFLNMFIGLMVTFLIGYVLSTNNDYIFWLFDNPNMYFIFFILEVVIVIAISAKLGSFSKRTLYALFYLYALVNAMTFASIFIVYNMSNVIYAFGITSLLFGGLSLYGYTTKKDITKLGSILFVGLIVVLISSFVNLFILKSDMISMIISIAILIIFILYTIYDINKLKRIYNENSDNKELLDKVSIMGSLQLYLDFINMFYQILNFISKFNN